MQKFLVGVDEAGRGPLAGPVAVGVVCLPAVVDIREMFPDVGDSKKLSPARREKVYALLEAASAAGWVRHRVVFSSAALIDQVGITEAVRQAVWEGVRALAPEPAGVTVLLDGLLSAPPEYVQETIVRGDASEPVISLASIAAKVARDHLMQELAKTYPTYGFEVHKGYGTEKHYAALRRHGLCLEHRKSFCTNV